MSTGWQWVIGLLVAGACIWLWSLEEALDARLDRHYHARVALEREVELLQNLVRQQDKQIDCYYDVLRDQRTSYRMRDALYACFELK